MIKNVFLLILFKLAVIFSVYGQEKKVRHGVTVITHGFAFRGSFNEDFLDFGREVYAAAGSKGTVYHLNDQGRYEKVIGSEDPNEEIIIVYNWSGLSWWFERKSAIGDLEAAADFLFAALMSPPEGLNLYGSQLLEKDLHFIGHSRGAILLLQLCHRIRRYLPKVLIEQMTLLDPHPATPFGDVKRLGNAGVTENVSLPCVYGEAMLCAPVIGCANGESVYLKMPENVISVDGYWRKDGLYESVSNGELSLGSFDGVKLNYNKDYYQLDEQTMSSFANPLGGAHSEVVNWYRGTIPTTGTAGANSNWYTPYIGSFFSENDSRYSVGFIHSRIGSDGDDLLLPSKIPIEQKSNLSEMDAASNQRQGFLGGLQRIFNGGFNFGVAGWYGKGGSADLLDFVVDNGYNKYYSLLPNVNGTNQAPHLKHNYMFFGTDYSGNTYQTLRFTFHVYSPIGDLSNGLVVKFYDFSGNEIASYPVSMFRQSQDKIVTIPIPESIRRKSGTFAVENLSLATINVGRFELTTVNTYPTGNNSLNASYDRPNHEVRLDWNDFATDETGYLIEKTDKEDFTGWVSVTTLAPNSNFYAEEVTLPSAKLWYRVRAEGSSRENPYSNSEELIISDRPDAPSQISAIEHSSNSILITWSDNCDFETSYELYYRVGESGVFELLKSLPAGTTSFTHTGIPTNTKVSYYIVTKEREFLSQRSQMASCIVSKLPVTSRINRVEAFFDNNDPGFGVATSFFNVIINEDAISFASPALNISNLNDGVHTLTVRARDNKGYWSQLHSTPFLKLSIPVDGVKLLDLQYSLDASAGGATWNTVFLDPNVNTNEGITINIEPNQISPLPDGIHFITVRAKDNKGFWSNYFRQSFLKLRGTYGDKKIVNLEYSIDNGLLIGTGTAVTLTPGKYANVSIDLPSLPNGKHFISLRSKDDGGYTSNITIDSFVVRDQSFCEKNSIVYYRSLINNARTYVWQQNDGSGWITITDGGLYSGARTQVLRLDSPPTAWYGYQYRCIVNGVPTTPFILKFSDTWTGAESDEWHNPNNWCCGGVPDENTDVVIDPATSRKPKITANGICRSLTLKPGSNVTVEDGNTLDIMGQQK